MPYFDGERTPEPSATRRARSPDCAPTSTREELARAAFEGVVCGLLDGLDALRAAGVDTDGRLLLVGGGARSAAFRRILADLSGRPVVVPEAPELVATGACVQAAAVLAAREPADDRRRVGTRHRSGDRARRPATATRYERAYAAAAHG